MTQTNKKERQTINQKRPRTSKMRRLYIARLAGRIAILILCLVTAFLWPGKFSVLKGWNFFKKLTPFHLLWLVWMLDMLWQILPIKSMIPLGSQKLFKLRYRPVKKAVNQKALREYIVRTTKEACKVMLMWIALTGALFFLKAQNIVDDMVIFLIGVIFYVCDLICVLIWCPFRLMLKNRCCTTCRIFNWDHLMMFAPMLPISGFFSRSLFVMAVVVWGIWELFVLLHPERFWVNANEALRCSSCTDKLCTQYCQGLFRRQASR